MDFKRSTVILLIGMPSLFVVSDDGFKILTFKWLKSLTVVNRYRNEKFQTF